MCGGGSCKECVHLAPDVANVGSEEPSCRGKRWEGTGLVVGGLCHHPSLVLLTAAEVVHLPAKPLLAVELVESVPRGSGVVAQGTAT
jgi:hypothetical protein